MYIKRTLILSKIGLENKKALATIQNNGNGKPSVLAKLQENVENAFAMVRFANSPIEVIPLCYDDCGDCFNGCLPEFFDCNDEIFIMIVCISNGRIIPVYLSGGNERRNCFYDEILKNLPFYYNKCMSLSKKNNRIETNKTDNDKLNAFNHIQNLSESGADKEKCESLNLNKETNENFVKLNNANQNVDKVENLKASDAHLFEPPTENEIDEMLTNSLLTECLTQKDKCENCAYKKAFYENDYVEDSDMDEKGNLFNSNSNASVYEKLKEENQREVNALKESVKSAINAGKVESYAKNGSIEDAQEDAGEYENDWVEDGAEQINGDEENGKVEEGGKESEENDNKQVNQQLNFYNQIEKSLNALFSAYPADETLEEKIEGGKFAKVDYENTGDFYSVGYISENGQPKYICYAIPCSAGSPPPKNMEEFSQYLPVDENRAYYLMYQNASDGKTIQF